MIGKIMQELRKNKKMTIADVAEAIGIKPRTYLSYETEEREPNITIINALADFYGVTTDYLLGREPPVNPFDMLALDTGSKNVMEMFAALPEETRQIILDAMIKLTHAAEKTEQSISLSSTRKGQEERAERAAEEQDGNKFA